MGVFRSQTFDLPLICIGNLAVGGSGKTPVTEYIVALLEGKRVAILSRGYGRVTKGYIKADIASTADTIGDEPLQYFHKFTDVTVAVCEDRITGINRLKGDHDIILLDDAFQHRKVKAGLNVLLFEYTSFNKPQFLLPAGNLREFFGGYRRADIALITKSPEAPAEKAVLNIRHKFNSDQTIPVLFSHLSYQQIKAVYKNNRFTKVWNEQSTIYLLTGIANPKPMLEYLKQHSKSVTHHDFPDHYKFSLQNITELISAFHKDPATNKIIVTTEKDAQRLLDASIKELLLDLPIFYLPIQVVINELDKSTFDQKILDYVSSTTRNR